MSHILIIYMTIKHILFMTATYLSIYTKKKRICNLSNHNPTLLKTTSGSTSHTICKSFNCSFVHLLSSLLILSLPWLYFPLVFWSRHSKLLLTDVTASGASFPSFADVLPSAWKAPARLSNKVVNRDSSQSPLSPKSLFWCSEDMPYPPYQAELKTCSASYLFMLSI